VQSFKRARGKEGSRAPKGAQPEQTTTKKKEQIIPKHKTSAKNSGQGTKKAWRICTEAKNGHARQQQARKRSKGPYKDCRGGVRTLVQTDNQQKGKPRRREPAWRSAKKRSPSQKRKRGQEVGGGVVQKGTERTNKGGMQDRKKIPGGGKTMQKPGPKRKEEVFTSL